jgi:hypothetical protein
MVLSTIGRGSMTEPHMDTYARWFDRRHPISGCGEMPTGDETV